MRAGLGAHGSHGSAATRLPLAKGGFGEPGSQKHVNVLPDRNRRKGSRHEYSPEYPVSPVDYISPSKRATMRLSQLFGASWPLSGAVGMRKWLTPAKPVSGEGTTPQFLVPYPPVARTVAAAGRRLCCEAPTPSTSTSARDPAMIAAITTRNASSDRAT